MVNPRRQGGGGPRLDPRLKFEEAAAAHRDGHLKKAEKLYRAVLKVQPGNPNACHNLALVYHAKGQAADALKSIHKALAIDRHRAEFHSTAGTVELSLGRPEKAVAAYGRSVELDPRSVSARIGHAIALDRAGRHADAEAALREATRLDPRSVRAWLDLGALLRRLNRFEDAIECFERAIAIAPQTPVAWNELGVIARIRGDGDRAIEQFRRALEIAPGELPAHFNLSQALREFGRDDEAMVVLRQAIEIDPDRPEPHILLALARTHTERDAEVDWLESFAAAPERLGPHDAHIAVFAYAKVLQDLGENDAAFEVLVRGNRMKRKTIDYDIDTDIARFSEIRKVFSAGALGAAAGLGCPDPTPVFVLGMPRSGTTLVEQILASHPEIVGAGELDDLRQLVEASPRFADGHPAAFARPDPAAIRATGEEYVERIRRFSSDARHVVDKAPSNAVLIGAIRMILPRAKLIRCVRDARDTCLSIFRHDLAGDQGYSWDLTEIGRYHAAHEELMAHWRSVVEPEFLYELDYETLVDDFEAEVRRLCAFVGVDFDPSCLDFHLTKRLVRTASMQQVRRPLFRSSIGAWRRHEAALAPLIDALGMSGAG